MNKQYIKQLEEANEKLRNKLERESLLRDVEKRRCERKFYVDVYYLNKSNLELSKMSEGKCVKPPLMDKNNLFFKNNEFIYNTYGMSMARCIINSHMTMFQRDCGSNIGGGISWRIRTASTKTRTEIGILQLEGWIMTCPRYPAWGGNYLEHYLPLQPSNSDKTEMHFKTYKEYAMYVFEKENWK
jgi:hypothetical protein